MSKDSKPDQEMTELARLLRDRGMTVAQAAKLCGVSVQLMDILAGGGVTAPVLAMKIGKGLGLTREQVRKLGQAFDGERFRRRTGVTPPDADMDQAWWRRYRESKPDKPRERTEPYLNEEKLLEHMLRTDSDPARVLPMVTGERTARGINNHATEERKRLIRMLEEFFELQEGALITEDRPGRALELVFILNTDAVKRCMIRQGLTAHEISMGMGG